MELRSTMSTVNHHGEGLVSLCHSTGTLLCTGRTPGDEAAPCLSQRMLGMVAHVLIIL